MSTEESKPEATKSTGNPYLDGRREWNERYGSYIAERNRWRNACFGVMALATGAIIAAAVAAGQPKLLPYVVEINGDGETMRVWRPESTERTDQRIVRAQLAQFVRDIRGVSSDASVQREAIERAYAMLSATDPAFTTLNDYMKANSPFARAAEETVTIEVRQVLPLTADTWRVEWTEKPRERRGAALPQSRWVGTMTVRPGEIIEANLLYNPSGTYVQTFDWAQDLEN